MKKKGSKVAQKKRIIPELVEVKVGNAVKMSTTEGKWGDHTLQVSETHVVSADKYTEHKERKKDAEETKEPGNILRSTDSDTSDDTSNSSITINPSGSNEERRDLYETKYAREKLFHNSFCQNEKKKFSIMEVIVLQVRMVLVEVLPTIKKILTKKT